MRLIDRLVGHASNLLVVFASIAIVMLMLHVVADVTGRYIFNNPLPGTLETVTFYYMVMLTTLPWAYVTRHEGQISVDMFTNWLSPRALHLLEVAVGLLMLVYVCVIGWKMGQEALATTRLGEVRASGSIQVITWPSRWFAPIAFGVMALAVIVRIVADFKAFLSPNAPSRSE